MTKDEALKLALEALETLHDENMDYLTRNKLGGENNQCMVFAREAITAIKAALSGEAQTRSVVKDEPVSLETVYETIIHWDEDGGKRSRRELARRIVDLYTTPPQRTWIGLTDEEISDCMEMSIQKTCRAIEAKLRSKNHESKN